MIPATTNGQLEAYCMMVERGKPAANLPIQSRYAEEAISIIKRHGLKYIKNPLSDGWEEIWVYKYPHIGDIIRVLPQVPKTAFDHWVNGKLFGYSEEAIHEFLKTSTPGRTRSCCNSDTEEECRPSRLE